MSVSLPREPRYRSRDAAWNLGQTQGFMQDQIIASHTRFGGHMDVNCEDSLLSLYVSDDLNGLQTRDTIYTHFSGITDYISMVLEDLFCSVMCLPVHPYFLPIDNSCYPSK